MTPPGFYAEQSDLSDPRAHQRLFDGLPRDVAGLCRVVQGVMIHDYFRLHLYGPPASGFHLASRQTLPVSERIDAILSARNQPITTPRQASARSVGTCRDFALLLCAMLRQHSVPARVRCGFARYFHPPSYEDHWVCEYWKPERRQWAIADAQLDEPHRAHLSIDFDATDVPRDQFLFAWQAWRLCRSSALDPTLFGHGDDTGAWFIRVNLARDLLSLCKRETSAWDTWRDAAEKYRSLDGAAVDQCDRIASLCEAAGESLGPPEPGLAKFSEILAQPAWQA